MKENLTISVDRAAKRKAEAYKKRTGVTLGRIFELGVTYAVGIAAAQDTSTKVLWADREVGVAADAFKPSDHERDDMLGALLRKHLPRRR
ncbi:MAG: hypothetical protein IT228_09515 [Flavobacteriales bacterium]|nr:hypothetical protein [Flavobacteriales bacterium]MCC6577565.1 hypothetical protein [Flavobacteriales bacterium]NUQ14655.1 hypothetical protein [Flavobacteriales bacterium]